MWLGWLVFCDCGFSLSALWWRRIKGLWELSDERDWLRRKRVLVLMVRAILSKSLNQFSVDSRGCVSSLFDLRPNYGRGNEDNDNFLPKVLFTHCCIQCPCPCSRPLSPHASTRESWTLTGKSRSVSCGGHCLFLLGLVHTRFYLCPPRVCFPSPVEVL